MPKETLTENNLGKISGAGKLVFRYFPEYARFIKDNLLVPYIQEQIRISREIKLPILKFFEGIPDDQLIAMSIGSHKEFLTYAEENRLTEQLEKSLELWIADKFTVIKRDEITAEDISLSGYYRKKALIKFLPSYTTDIHEIIEIINEIDSLSIEYDTAATNVYISLLKDRINEQLRESEQRYKQAQELSHAGTWAWDLINGKIEWTEALYKIYGIAPGTDLSFESILAFSDPEDQIKIKERLRDSLKTLLPSEAYYHITLRDGVRKILHTKSEVFADDSGRVYKMIGVIQDVTERQQLIEKLQRSEDLYKQAQAISHIGNWAWDMETKKIDWSDEIYRIHELELQSLDISTSLTQYTHPDDEDLIRSSISYAVETQQPFDFNYRIVLKSGKIKTLNARGELKSEPGSSCKIYGTLQDMTEQKAVEKQLKDYQEFIKKITDVTPSIIASYNIYTGKYSFINDAIEKLLGYPAAMIMCEGVTFLTSIVHPDDLPGLMEKNQLALNEANKKPDAQNEPVVEFKYRMKNSSGYYRWFHTYGTVFERNDKGLVESVLNISVDITDQELAEQDLFQKNIKLQQSNTRLEEYAYVASHDLKEPLRKISTYSDRILTTQSDALSDDGKSYLNKIMDASMRMHNMIDDLLSVSTILGNTAFENYNLTTILEEAIVSLEYKIEESKAVIEADELPTVSIIPSQFRQLFQNIISNSLKFARKEVRPHVKISHKELSNRAIEYFELTRAKKYLRIQFEDNGIGFENEYARKIFSIFQRLHGKTEYDGTGIGLAICKKIVENHGGIIFAQGIVNQSAIFTIIIPA